MNNITGQFFQSGLPTRQNSHPDFRAAAYVKEQSFSLRESLNTDLVLNTRDGDRVTLAASQYSLADGYLYDARGIVQNERGTAAVTISQREITLASGQSFSFSVQGDLSEDELKDIESLLKGIDQVISEMTEGNMEGAIDKALELKDYDSVSSFAADIHYQRSYEMRSAATATTRETGTTKQENAHPYSLPKPASDQTNALSQIPEKIFGNLLNIEKLLDKLTDQLGIHDDKQKDWSKDPVQALFQHHLDKLEKSDGSNNSLKDLLTQVMQKYKGVTGYKPDIS